LGGGGDGVVFGASLFNFPHIRKGKKMGGKNKKSKKYFSYK